MKMNRRFQKISRPTEEGEEVSVKNVTVNLDVQEIDDRLMFVISCPHCGLLIRTDLDKFEEGLEEMKKRVAKKGFDMGPPTGHQIVWMRGWREIGRKILKLPEWMQEILLDDINVAVENRIKALEVAARTNAR